MSSILEAKKQYRDLFLMRLAEDQAVVFRLIKWGEYKNIRNLLLSFPALLETIKDDIFVNCVIEYADGNIVLQHDDNIADFLDNIPAGIVDVIFEAIMYLSGAPNTEKFFYDLHNVRNSLMSDYERILSYMVAMTLSQDVQQLEDMYYYDILNKIAFVEKVMSQQLPAVPFSIQNKDSKNTINFEEENRKLTGF